jgi:hypothetical protein
MCVDQAGQHRRTLDVDLAGAIARGRLDLGLGADRDDLRFSASSKQTASPT